MPRSVINAWLQVCTVSLGLAGSSQLAEARCRSARPEEVPHGANEIIVLTEQEVKQIRGVVSIGWDDQFAQDVVVEVYNYPGRDDSYEAVKQALQTKRIAACVTGEDGKFTFSGVKPGKYLLLLGTHDVAGINEVNAILHVTPDGSREKLKIVLKPGT